MKYEDSNKLAKSYRPIWYTVKKMLTFSFLVYDGILSDRSIKFDKRMDNVVL